MAMNDFLTVDQVCEMLGKSAEEIETLVAEGHLTPVWDGDVAYYRRGEIEQVAAKEGSSIVDLAAAEDMSPQVAGQTDSFASALSSQRSVSSLLPRSRKLPAARSALSPRKKSRSSKKKSPAAFAESHL
jgi:hypothetical protein